jgi:hydroxyacylglutathione hydrolase
LTDIKDFVKETDALRWGGFAARVLHTPGHTPGSISLVVEEDAAKSAGGAGAIELPKATILQPRLLAGDTLFRGSIGRTDLWGGSYPQILDSIREKLLVLPDEMVVYSGHGGLTTIGFERENNPFLI